MGINVRDHNGYVTKMLWLFQVSNRGDMVVISVKQNEIHL